MEYHNLGLSGSTKRSPMEYHNLGLSGSTKRSPMQYATGVTWWLHLASLCSVGSVIQKHKHVQRYIQAQACKDLLFHQLGEIE